MTPTPPPGFELETGPPAPPPGFELETQAPTPPPGFEPEQAAPVQPVTEPAQRKGYGITGDLPDGPELSFERVGGALVEGGKDVARSLNTGLAAVLEWDRNKWIEAQERELGEVVNPMETQKAITENIKAASELPALKTKPAFKGSSGYVEDFVRMTPQMLSQVGTSLAVGPLAGMSQMGLQIVGGTVENLEAQGVERSRAISAGIGNAIMQAPLEQFGIGKITKAWKLQKPILVKIRKAITAVGAEWFTEFLQAFPEMGTNIWAKDPDMKALKALDSWLDASAQGAYEGLLTAPWAALGLAGGGRKGAEEAAPTAPPIITPETVPAPVVPPHGAPAVQTAAPPIAEPGPGPISAPVVTIEPELPAGFELEPAIPLETVDKLRALGYEDEYIYTISPKNADYIIDVGRKPEEMDNSRLVERRGDLEARDKFEAEKVLTDQVKETSGLESLKDEITSHITENKGLERGLSYYKGKFKNFSDDDLKNLVDWTQEPQQTPYIAKRLGSEVDAEIRFRATTAPPPKAKTKAWGTLASGSPPAPTTGEQKGRSRTPLITADQKKRAIKKKAVKETQINIENAKEAKEGVRQMILDRRKSLNLSTYETNLFVNDIEKVTTKVQREIIPFIIEKTDIPKSLKRPDLEKEYLHNKEQLEPIAAQVKKHFDSGWEMMKKHIPDMSAEQIENYVTHIWDLSKKQKPAVTNWFITQNKFLKKRYIDTLHEGIEKLGLKPRTLDIAEIIRIHDSVTHRAIENAKFVDDLKALKKEGVPLIERSDKAPQDWVLMDHPALRRGLVIPGELKSGEKVSQALRDILQDMGVAIGRRISPVAFGKPTGKLGEYRSGDPPEVRFQRFMSKGTIAHEIGHHINSALSLGDEFLSNYKTELYAINKTRIESRKGDTGKYGEAYARSTEEQIAEFFATLFTDVDRAYRLAPNATVDALGRLKQDGAMSKLVDFDFEKGAKNLIEEQLNTMVKLPVKVHPDLVKPLKVVFESRFDHEVIQAYEMINGLLKKTKLSISLFHHAALGETGVATMGLIKTADIYFNLVKIYRAMVQGKLAIYEEEALARKWIGAGLQVGATQDIPVSMIQDKLNSLVRKTKNMPLINRATEFISSFNEVWDKALWNYLHDTLKLYGAEALGAKMDPTKPLQKQREEIAQLVNDTFGGQNWDMLMVSPKMVQMMTWSLLSPDWTISTTRQALAPTGIGAIHKETKALRKKLGRMFWIKAALYFGGGINMLNVLFRTQDEKENPEYYKDEERDFWDKTMWGNAIGKKTNLFVGRYEDGTERYIRWGKQFRDFPELVIDDTGFSPISAVLKKVGGKTAPLVQLASQIATGHSPSGFRNNDIHGKKGWDKTLGIFKTLIKSPLPFSSRSLLTKNKKFHITDLAFPSSKGMSRYKAVELFKHAIVKKDNRFLKELYQDVHQNNLPVFTLFKAALTSLKAETSRELNRTRKTIKETMDALGSAVKRGDTQDTKRASRKLNRLAKEELDLSVGTKSYAAALYEVEKYHIEKGAK